jgi:hypothetical protein
MMDGINLKNLEAFTMVPNEGAMDHSSSSSSSSSGKLNSQSTCGKVVALTGYHTHITS